MIKMICLYVSSVGQRKCLSCQRHALLSSGFVAQSIEQRSSSAEVVGSYTTWCREFFFTSCAPGFSLLGLCSEGNF